MKKLFALLLGLAACVMLCSCEKETILTVNQASLSFNNSGGSQTVNIVANKVWSASSNQSWCKVSPSSGDGSDNSNINLSVSCDANTTYDARTCTITITCEELTKTISVSQAEVKGLIISQTEYNLTNDAQTITVEVQANVQYTVEIDNACKSWIKQESTKALSSNIIKLAIAKNGDYDERQGTVVVKQENGDLEGVITIHQDENYGILASQSEYSISNDAQSIDVEIKYNVEYDVVIPDSCKDWISAVNTKGLSSRFYTISIAKNDTYDDRQGSITFKQKNGSLSGTVKIFQSQTDGIIAEKKEYLVSSDEQQFNVRISSNVDYIVIIDEGSREWLKQVKTKGLDEGYIILQVSKNDGDMRTGRVVLKSDRVQEEISIIQKADGIIEFDDDYFKAYCVENYDKNGDGKVSFSEVGNVSSITVYTDSITSLKGIEHFTALVSLTCEPKHNGETWSNWGGGCYIEDGRLVQGLLTELDLSNNEELRFLSCKGNKIHSIVFSERAQLEELICSYNPIENIVFYHFDLIKKLDIKDTQISISDYSLFNNLLYLDCTLTRLSDLNVSNNYQLQYLRCGFNSLKSIDVDNNSELRWLDCGVNKLDTVNVSHNGKLLRLMCYQNNIHGLDLSNNEALTDLDCHFCKLSQITLSHNIELEWLNCSTNLLSELDISNNSKLAALYCYDNQLRTLDLSNNPSLSYLMCNENPYLTEIWLKTGQDIEYFLYDTDIATIKYK